MPFYVSRELDGEQRRTEEPVRKHGLADRCGGNESKQGAKQGGEPWVIRECGKPSENGVAQHLVRTIEVPKTDRDAEDLKTHPETQHRDREEQDGPVRGLVASITDHQTALRQPAWLFQDGIMRRRNGSNQAPIRP